MLSKESFSRINIIRLLSVDYDVDNALFFKKQLKSWEIFSGITFIKGDKFKQMNYLPDFDQICY
jgi:hypothetical protein